MSENLCFSEVFRGHRNGTLDSNGLMMPVINIMREGDSLVKAESVLHFCNL